MAYFGKYNKRNYRTNHSAVDCQTSCPKIKDLKKIIFIVVPLKGHIVKSGPYDGKYNGVKGKIQIEIRILSSALCI